MRLRRGAIALTTVLALAVLAGCGDDDGDDGGESQLPNPASAFCESEGGTVEIERDDDGNERGICVLPDGTRVDEWDHFRAEGGED